MSTTVATILSYANTLIKGNSTISDSQGIAFLNDGNSDFHLDLIKRGVEASQLQEAYRDASIPPSGQGSTFLYPDDMLLLKQITVNMVNAPTGANAQNYIVATQIDIGNTQENVAFEFLRLNQPVEQPLIDDRGDWYEIFPTFTSQMNLSQAIRIFYYLKPVAYTATSDVISYPESLDPYILVYKILSIYYDTLTQAEASAYWEKKYRVRLNRLIDTLVRGADRPVQTSGLGLTGAEF